MSASLESLMPEIPPGEQGPSQLHRLVMFLVIGGGAAAGFVLLSSIAIALLPMVDNWLVSALCYAGFIPPVYLLHRRFTFASDVDHLRALPRYAAVQMMALALATLFSFLLHGALSLPSLSAAILVTTLTSGVNYLVLRNWAFGFNARVETVPA